MAAALVHGRELVCAARDLIEVSQGARIRDTLEACGARVVPRPGVRSCGGRGRHFGSDRAFGTAARCSAPSTAGHWADVCCARGITRLGLPDAHIYDHRHIHITYRAAAGVDPRALADQVGHKDPGYLYRRYAHAVTAAQRHAAALAGEVLALAGRSVEK